jgi:hypothetical protein
MDAGNRDHKFFCKGGIPMGLRTSILSRLTCLKAVLAVGVMLIANADASDDTKAKSVRQSATKEVPSEKQMAERVAKFMDQWHASGQYTYYILMMAHNYDFASNYAGVRQEMFVPDASAQKYVYVNPATRECKKDLGAHLVGLTVYHHRDGDTIEDFGRNGMCIVLSGFGQPVPVRVAEVAANSWAQGFVTRLIVGQYFDKWAESEKDPKRRQELTDVLAFPSKMDLKIRNEQLKEFVTRANYCSPEALKDGKSPSTIAISEEDFEVGLRRLLKTVDINTASMLYGWQAASKLVAEKKSGEVANYEAAMDLLKARYTPEELGEMCGFTLHYLFGYIRATTIRIGRQDEGNPTKNDEGILKELAREKDIAPAKELLAGFQKLLHKEVVALAMSDPKSYPKGGVTKEKALLAYSQFLDGFGKGIISSSDEVIFLAHSKGYVKGHADGFVDGYSKGYAHGFSNGYAVGQKDAWNDAQTLIDALKSQLATANNEIDQLKGQRARDEADPVPWAKIVEVGIGFLLSLLL